MKTIVNIATIFPKYLFWDMDFNKLDLKKDKDIIIPRALYATTPETFNDDIEKLESLYTHTQIIKVLKATKELVTNEVCKLVALRYGIQQFLRFQE